MITPALGRMLGEARERCLMISANEEILGYVDSAILYEEIASEFDGLASWVVRYARERRLRVWSALPR